MSQVLDLSIKGLHTYPSELSGVPQGALSIADDVNISRVNIVEPRRGFDFLGYDPTAEVKKLVFYNSGLFAHYGTTFGYGGTTASPAAWTSKGTLSAPSNATSVRTAAVSNNLYLTNSTGISKLDAVTNNIYDAGIPKGTLIESGGALVASGTAIDWTSGTRSVAYRYLIARKDANNNVVSGGVSARYVVGATSDSDVPLKVYLPSGLDTTYYAQVYRTAGTNGTPNDEMQLVYEQVFDSIIISNKYFTFTDIVPDDLLGAALYTNPSQQGLVNDNAQPPLARDIAEYKNHLFFADVTSKYRYTITLVACGGSGLAAGNTFTLVQGATTETYTAHKTPTGTTTSGSPTVTSITVTGLTAGDLVYGTGIPVGTTISSVGASTITLSANATASGTVTLRFASVSGKKFAVDPDSSSISTRIDNTARSLVSIINQQSSGLFYAYMLSDGGDGLPGKIMIEERTNTGTVFTLASNNSVAWNPSLATAVNATNDEYKNGLMYSKQGIPEAVPLKNLIRIGSSDDRIKRIVALRDGLFIFKEKDGVYVLRGENEASFSVSLLDGTAKVKSADSLAVVNNLIYGLFDAGICEVSDSGVSVVGLPIKDKILTLFGTALASVQSYAFGVGYEVDGKYILALPSVEGDTDCDQQLVFDVYGRTWCRWTLGMRSACVDPSLGKLYYGQNAASKIKVERKAYNYTDYVDYGSLCTITAYTGTTVTINNTATMAIGDILVQGANNAYIESINLSAGTVTIDAEQAWTLNTADVDHLKAIYTRVEWNAEFAGNPAGYKQFYECSLLFKQGFQKEATVYFYSDTNPGESSISLTSSSGNGAWGEFAWGDEVFGGETVKEPTRLGVPRAVSRCNQLSIRFESRVGYSDFQLNGVALTFNPISTRTAR
jgi:hypothetical protein